MSILPERKNKIVNDYITISKNLLKYNYPQLTENELEDAIVYSIEKRYKEEPAYIYNNYKNITVNMSIYEIICYIMEKQPIITAYGVLFQQHGKSKNPLAKLFKTFLSNRELNKSKMFQFPPGSEEYEKYNLMQLLDKLDANGLYGAIGSPTCMLFNVHVAASITSQARSSISAAILFFEMFLNNNVKYRSLNEVISYIYNIISEKDQRVYVDREVLDRDITKEECLAAIAKTIDVGIDSIWIPDEKDIEIIWEIICGLNQEDINRIYYKNNLFPFVNNSRVTKIVKKMLHDLKYPFANPNKVPEEIKENLEVFQDLLKEYVYYGYQIIDRIDRNINMIKTVTILSDTDSAIVNLDGWYRFILNKIVGEKMTIATKMIDAIVMHEYDEFGDRVYPGTLKEYYPQDAITYIKSNYDYDFYSDELIEIERSINPIKIIPQDNVRYSIINILSHCLTNLVNDYMNSYCDLNNSNINNPDKRCRLFMKNEFLFKSVLLTYVKKHYATIQELREGHNMNNSLDVKGLAMMQTTLNPSIRREMQNILYEDILNVNKIDQVQVMKKIAMLEKKIWYSLESGSKEFYKPLQVKPMRKYEDPLSIQGIKASIVWNTIKDDDLIGLNLEEKNSIDVVKVNITPSTAEKIKDKYPDTYQKIISLFNNPKMKKEVTALAIPKDVEVIPDWIKEFIDYNTIINDNIATFPYESIGLTRMNSVKNNNVNYINILQL